MNLSQLTAGSRRFFAVMSEWVAQRVAFGRSMPRHALRSVLVLLHRTVLASGAGKLQMRCAATCRSTRGRSSVMRERRSALNAFLVDRNRPT